MELVIELCHNCATKAVLAAKTDFIDRLDLLILRNLLKTQMGPKIPAYRLARQFSIRGIFRQESCRGICRRFFRGAAAGQMKALA